MTQFPLDALGVGLSLLITAGVFPLLPDEFAIHWNLAGEVDGTTTNPWAIWFFPVTTLGVYGFLLLAPRIDPLKASYTRFEASYHRIRTAIVWVYLALQIFLLIGIWHPDTVPLAIVTLVSVLFIVIGNELTRVRANWFLGLRTPWTLADEDVWRKSNRLMGRVLVIAGVLGVAGLFVNMGTAVFILVSVSVLGSLVGVLYSYRLYQQKNLTSMEI